jgi:hypothetical protein
MAFVGQIADPWDVPAKQAVLVMQKIWDATNTREYEITTSTAVYKKVCGSVCLYDKRDDDYCASDSSTCCGLVA